uniref:SFRICE_005283 n=1 Tax=Spodoptera frugiperda TaxID=7108 RepID=A0A2H1VFJ3_SPOFR
MALLLNNIVCRLMISLAAFRKLCNIAQCIKTRVCNQCVLPAMIYRIETWSHCGPYKEVQGRSVRYGKGYVRSFFARPNRRPLGYRSGDKCVEINKLIH